MPSGGCWFTNFNGNYNVNVPGYLISGNGPLTSSICTSCNQGNRAYNYTCQNCTYFQKSCLGTYPCGASVSDSVCPPIVIGFQSQSCALYSQHNTTNSQYKNTLSPDILTTVEWRPLVVSNYYRINVTQNDKKKSYIIESSNLCKQVANVDVLPDIHAFVQICGFTENPTDPSVGRGKVNDVYTVRYTLKIDDENTCSYENLSTVRRRDKETKGSVVYETELIEGVSSRN